MVYNILYKGVCVFSYMFTFPTRDARRKKRPETPNTLKLSQEITQKLNAKAEHINKQTNEQTRCVYAHRQQTRHYTRIHVPVVCW